MTKLFIFYFLLGMGLSVLIMRGAYTVGKSLEHTRNANTYYWKGYEAGFNSAHEKYDRVIKYLRYIAKCEKERREER